MDDTIDEGKQLTLYQGSVSPEKAAADKIRRKVEALNEALDEADEIDGLEVKIHGRERKHTKVHSSIIKRL